MYKSKRILGFIPARGGSKGLLNKNIRPLLGKPLISWTIEQGLASKLLDSLIVNTDDDQIAKISREYGAEVPFMRPLDLAQDSSKVIDAVIHALNTLEKMGRTYDFLALLEPTSPLRNEKDIDNSIKKLIDAGNKANSLISVGKIALENPVYAKRVTREGMVEPYSEQKGASSLRQEIPDAYFPYGVIYLSKIDAIRKFKEVYPEKVLAYEIERWQNYEINDVYDFLCVETILKKKMEEKS